MAACDSEVTGTGGSGATGTTTTHATTTVTVSTGETTSTGETGGSGGTGGAPPEAPPLRNPLPGMTDHDVALQSLLLMGVQDLGSTNQTCSHCHSMNRGQLTSWKNLTDTAVTNCFSDVKVKTKEAAEAVLACMRQQPNDETSPYMTPKMGIYASAAKLPWFEFVFKQAFGTSADANFQAFHQLVGMPKDDLQTPFTQADFDIVAEWFARGLPLLEQFLPEDPPPGGCVQDIQPDVATHVSDMATQGWRAVNAGNDMLMFGCAGASTPLDCLSSYPLSTDTTFGMVWSYMPGATLRVLKENTYASSYWTRSSADGRFVGHGGGPTGGSTIIDLNDNQQIPVDGAYDPGFFPDNSGFVFQGTANGATFCEQSLLNTSNHVTFMEPQCHAGPTVGLYQHVGAALGGGDYWAVNSHFVSDDGGHNPTLDNPVANFGNDGYFTLTPMVHTGSQFLPHTSITKSIPGEGDVVISPSSRLLLSRVAGPGWEENGMTLRKLNATPSGSTYTVTTPQIGRYCVNGGKPAFSYDERWLVLHRYVTGADAIALGFTGPSDPAFALYASQGASNIYLLDLVTGQLRRVTGMLPGQYALFPHFRSDGWIYFMVRNISSNHEYIVASDAALTLE